MCYGSIFLFESLIQRSDKFLSKNAETLQVVPLAGSDDRAATDVAPPQLELKHTDFPNVKFWFKRNWSKKVGSEPPRVFVETENGDPVGEDRLESLRKYARNLFQTIDKSTAPPTWKQAPTAMRQGLHRLMIDKFPELRLCDSDWKVDQVVSGTYTSWHSYWVKRLGLAPKTQPQKRRKTTSSVSRVSKSIFSEQH
jgi:hypothetical protein